MASPVYVLYEHATGYALFRVKEFEEVAAFLPQVEKSSNEFVKFKGLVDFVAFQPFKSGPNALDNVNCVSEGVLHEDLSLFLETNLPKVSKKNKFVLGVADGKIGATIQDSMGYSCSHTEVVPEILRGIRLHADKLIDGLSAQTIASAELGLGRSYSRAKVKFNVNRADNMVIQSISLLDQLDKDVNTFAMRLREWYSYHFPELIKIVPDNYTFAKVSKVMGNRKELGDEDDLLEKLTEVVTEPEKAQAIINAAKSSMGMDISAIDLINIETFASKVISLAEYRAQLMQYLSSRMNNIAPNLSTLVGETVGARLISHAGSLINLAKYPASTVQILGAEKALFRALKTRGNTPKYGLIFHSTFISRAGSKNKGRISRFLANKCSIASRIDCFVESPSIVFGSKLKDQVEERLKFYETGEKPRKNIDVMKEALEEAKTLSLNEAKKKKKAKKKMKKEKARENAEEQNGDHEENNVDATEAPTESKKKKKRKVEDADEAIDVDVKKVKVEDNDQSKKLQLEKAYCEYRMNEVNTCLQTLKNISEPTLQVKELMAQALYRLERYDECYELYIDLIKNSEDEYEDERETNLSAVIASLSLYDNKQNTNIAQLGEKTYELCYNKACVYLGSGDYKTALSKLNDSEDLCRKTLDEEGASEEEIEGELGLIKAQMGYAHQKLNEDDIALKLYTQVLKQKPSDVAVIAVTSNNIVTVNKEQNIFDSRKKMKAAINETLESKLTSAQKSAIAFNNCLLLMLSNQNEACRKQIQNLKSKSEIDSYIIEAALLCKEKRFNDAINILKGVISRSNSKANSSIETSLTLVQLLLNQGHVSEALTILRGLDVITYKLAIVSALVVLYLSLEEKEAAIEVLKDTIKWYKRNKPSSYEVVFLSRETARLLILNGKASDAVEILEDLRKSDPTNAKILAQLISAYSQVDPRKAEEISKQLPPVESHISNTDIDILEASNWSLGAKYVKKTTKSDQSPAVRLREKRKKKKKILPKNYDPNVDPDPERWLPRWQRSTYKKKKDKRGTQSVGRGTQGAVAAEGDIPSKPSPKAGVTNVPQQGPRQQRPAQKKKKKTTRR
ncbi:nucleolar protein 56-like isoform X1 [Leptotrombidium deliense]|uniref:Nucleolar protein 56 n=1 Tax=Leptotrombidium deliense TaxID=299467 RepID=A0A443SQV4_9ACAR|nr:nucleolar protein 56-like isoform X1 [Leptotrombidium deliense]